MKFHSTFLSVFYLLSILVECGIQILTDEINIQNKTLTTLPIWGEEFELYFEYYLEHYHEENRHHEILNIKDKNGNLIALLAFKRYSVAFRCGGGQAKQFRGNPLSMAITVKTWLKGRIFQKRIRDDLYSCKLETQAVTLSIDVLNPKEHYNVTVNIASEYKFVHAGKLRKIIAYGKFTV